MKHFLDQFKAKVISKKQPLITTALLTMMVTGYQNCQQKEEFFEKASLTQALVEPPIENIKENPDSEPAEPSVSLCQNGSSSDLICNPLGGGNSNPGGPVEPPAVAQSKLGLIARLYEGQNQWNNIDKYFKDGYKHQEDMYFSNFNVPTRSFDEGFGFGDSDYLKNRNGEKLIEWFAIEAQGHLLLPETESSGKYHIATLSDDGIQVSVGGQLILSNPNTHAPTVDCASSLIELEKGVEKEFSLRYFQGPRYHIALVTYIKKMDSASEIKASCSKGKDLIKAGYKVISPSWFTLPVGY